MVRDVDVAADGAVGVLVALTVAGCPLRNEIEQPGERRPSSRSTASAASSSTSP